LQDLVQVPRTEFGRSALRLGEARERDALLAGHVTSFRGREGHKVGAIAPTVN
jgi:hypothetical protein